MRKKPLLKFSPEGVHWLASQLIYKNARYDVTLKDSDNHTLIISHVYTGDLDEFGTWLAEEMAKAQFPPTPGMLRLVNSISVEKVEFDEYVQDENASFSLPPITLFLPTINQILQISEGDGSNLSDEDKEDGIVDYLYYN